MNDTNAATNAPAQTPTEQKLEQTAEEIAAAQKAKEDHELAAKLANIPAANFKLQEFKFNFRKDDNGDKRPSISLNLPVPTLDGVIELLKDEKARDFLLDVLAGEVFKAAKLQVGDDTKPVNTQEELDLSKVTIQYLASMPPAQRRGGGIAKEIWDAFAKDYAEVMPAITGKKPEQIANAVKIYLARFQPVKTQKPVLKKLQEQLDLWSTNTKNLEDFGEVLEFLNSKIEEFMSMDEAKLLENL